MVLFVADDHVAGLVVDGEALEALELARLAASRAEVAHVREVVGPEDLDARVARVRHQDEALGVRGDAARMYEVARRRALLAEALQVVAVAICGTSTS